MENSKTNKKKKEIKKPLKLVSDACFSGDIGLNRHQLWDRIKTLINQHINDKQISERLLGLIDDYGIESYGEGSDDANLPEFY
jgi:hypothetical protein